MAKQVPSVISELSGLPVGSMTNTGSNSSPEWSVLCKTAQVGDLVCVTLKKSRSLKIVKLIKANGEFTFDAVTVYPVIKDNS